MAVREHLMRIIFIIIGSVIAAFSIEKILLPVTILDGGIVGVSIIINKLVPVIPLGTLTILLNLPFVIIGGRKLGKSFFIYTGTGMALFSIFLSIFARVEFEVTEDALLATVFGGALLGVGVGMIIKNGGCLDGTEATAILLSHRTHIPVGTLVLVMNVVIFSVAGVLFGPDRAMYSLLTYFITSRVIDYIDFGIDQAKSVMIITDQAPQIAEDIYNTLGRTVTFIKGEGLISGEKTVLYCVITRLELSTLRRIIEKDDYQAFMTVADVKEIVGRHIKTSEAMDEVKKRTKAKGADDNQEV
ncbi:MAG: YitT family protein [Lachnospiraceae bacterium]|nr:YitT family protein [Lachnospiraceae bacterium]